MRLEKFEEEYVNEITKLKTLQFEVVRTPEFKIPAYTFIYKKALSIAFAVPAVAFMFAFFFYINENTQINSDLSQIEASNDRILNQIDSLEYENTL
jgi:hypothetical protein